MTSRERVLTTLQHKEPDKVPIDFGGMRSTGIMAIAYSNLKKHLGIKSGVSSLLILKNIFLISLKSMSLT
jgi:hypothetical protein